MANVLRFVGAALAGFLTMVVVFVGVVVGAGDVVGPLEWIGVSYWTITIYGYLVALLLGSVAGVVVFIRLVKLLVPSTGTR
jgi:hypothetical protein